MGKQTYKKVPISFLDQIALLKNRGLVIPDEQKALSFLQEISYYRVSAYFLPYQLVKGTFNDGVTFAQIVSTYTFDRELRLLIFDCIERIEIAIRTQFIYAMAYHHGDSHWQDNHNHFTPAYKNKIGKIEDPYSYFQTVISKAKTAKTPEVFIKHYVDNYDSPLNPPSWMCMELLTIGELSRLYARLSDKADKKRIAGFFDLHPTVFTSWLHTITYVRNICAHHSRLWNKEFAIIPEILLKPKGRWLSQPFENNKRIFYFLCLLRYIMQRANPGNTMPEKLATLFAKYPNVPIQYLGIPSDKKGGLLEWRNEPIWK